MVVSDDTPERLVRIVIDASGPAVPDLQCQCTEMGPKVKSVDIMSIEVANDVREDCTKGEHPGLVGVHAGEAAQAAQCAKDRGAIRREQSRQHLACNINTTIFELRKLVDEKRTRLGRALTK